MIQNQQIVECIKSTKCIENKNNTHTIKKQQYRQEEIINTIAETIMSYPPNVCPSCIDTILEITRTKIMEKGLLRKQ